MMADPDIPKPRKPFDSSLGKETLTPMTPEENAYHLERILKGEQAQEAPPPRSAPAAKIEHIPAFKNMSELSNKCSRTKADGIRCKNWAMRGGPVCAKHGGRSRVIKDNAGKRVDRAKVERMIMTMRERGLLRSDGENLHPLAHLLNELYLSAGVVHALGQMVGDLEDVTQHGGENSGREEAVLFRIWSEERDRHAQFAMMCVKAGVAERTVMLAEKQAELVASAIRGILLDLGVSQDPRAPQIVRKHLMALSPSSDEQNALTLPPAGSSVMTAEDKAAIRES